MLTNLTRLSRGCFSVQFSLRVKKELFIFLELSEQEQGEGQNIGVVVTRGLVCLKRV